MENTARYFESLAYGDHPRHILDICLPKEGKVTGVLLYIHGGAWIGGDKDCYRPNIKAACNDLGCAAATMNYRYISPDVNMYDLLDDITAALAFIKDFAAQNGVTLTGSILTGGSAGGHLSLLYAYSRMDIAPIPPLAVADDCGPSDLTDDGYFIFMKPEERYSEIAKLLHWSTGIEMDYHGRMRYEKELLAISPISYVCPESVPTIINHGKKDSVVSYRNAEILAKKLTDCGVEHVFNPYPNSDHGLESDPDHAKYAHDMLYHYVKRFF